MLLEYGFKNFFSFKEGGNVSFKLDSNCPTHISQSQSYSKVIGVKGANGSGKTNVLKALSFISVFASTSFTIEPDEQLAIQEFFNSDDPIEMYVEFGIKNLIYRYEIAIKDDEVVSEVLYRKNKKEIKLFERSKNKLAYRTSELKNFDNIKLRKNVSLISLAHQYEFNELKEIHKLFSDYVSNVSYKGLREQPISITVASKFLHKNPKAFEFVKDFICKSDTGISDIKIDSTKNSKGEDEYFPKFLHPTGKKKFYTNEESESSGTKALFRYLGIHWICLTRGSVAIVDEIDINLHPYILPRLLDLYLDPKTNPNDAQLIFTTHNTEILNYLGRYRTYLVNKNNNESYLYRLDEIPGDILRNDRPISPAYLDGKIGGVPLLK